MLKPSAKNLITVLSLLAFLIAGAGNSFGYALCFGDDGHTRVEKATVNGCIDCEEVSDTPWEYTADNFSYEFDEKTRSCSDLLLDKDNPLISKRNSKAADIPTLERYKARLYLSPNLHAGLVAPALQVLRVSQAILAHRTVVLLN